MFKRFLMLSLSYCAFASGMSAQIADPAGAARNTAVVQAGALVNVPDVMPTLNTLNEAAMSTVSDLSRMRIEKWKADSSLKQQSQQNVDSLQRNLTAALPQLVGQVRQSPNSASANFKLYRNLNVLYDVLSSVAESSGAFGAKEEFQTLATDIGQFDHARRALADRLEMLTAAQDTTIASLRTQIQTQAPQVTQTAPAPKRIVVDESETKKKPVPRKKPAATPSAAAPATSATPK